MGSELKLIAIKAGIAQGMSDLEIALELNSSVSDLKKSLQASKTSFRELRRTYRYATICNGILEHRSPHEMADQLGINVACVYRDARKLNVKFARKGEKPGPKRTPKIVKQSSRRLIRRPEIDELLHDPMPLLKELAAAADVTIATVSNYLHKSDQYEMWKEGRNHWCTKIDELLCDPMPTLKELSERVEVSASRVTNYLRATDQHGLWKEGRKKAQKEHPRITRRPEIDELLHDPMPSLRELGEAAGVCRERVRQYLGTSGQHEEWKEGRERLKIWSKKSEVRNLTRVLRQRIVNIEGEKDPARGYAVAYTMRKRVITPFEDVYALFSTYLEAQNAGERIGFQEIAERAGFSDGSQARSVLATQGLQSLNWSAKYLSETELDALRRVHEHPLSSVDIQYFMRVQDRSNATINTALRNIGQRKSFFGVGRRFNYKLLTYRLASQVYEAQDAEFSTEETVELLDTIHPLVGTAINMRDEVAPIIVDALRAIYDAPEHELPYLTDDLALE